MVVAPVRARAGRPENPAVAPALARAAVELLAAGEPVTVENVCRAVRVSRPVFYRRFPNADALVSHVVTERFAGLVVPDAGTLAGDVRAVLASWRELLTDPATVAGVSRVTAAQHRAGVDATGILGPCETAIGLVLDRAVERGQARPGRGRGVRAVSRARDAADACPRPRRLRTRRRVPGPPRRDDHCDSDPRACRSVARRGDGWERCAPNREADTPAPGAADRKERVMPSFQNPVPDVDEAREAMRGLAYATRHIAHAEDTYPVLGSVTRAVEGLQQVLRQLAAWHHTARPRAASDGGDRTVGAAAATAAADALITAAAALDGVWDAVNTAWSHNGRIAWRRDTPSPAPPAIDRAQGRARGGRSRARHHRTPGTGSACDRVLDARIPADSRANVGGER